MSSSLATPGPSRPESPELPILYLPTPIHPDALALAHEHFDVVTPDDSRGPTWYEHAVASVVSAGRLKQADVAKAHKLKVITRNGVGCDSVPLETCRAQSIVVTNQPGCNAKAVAEVALGLAILVTRKLAQVDLRLKRGERLVSQDWRAESVEGKTLGLVGMGDIARATAKKFSGAFDTPVIVYSPTSSPLKWTEQDPSGQPPVPHRRVSSLDELLAEADIVSLHCPLNAETKDMIGEEQLARMKSSAILINTARGGLVDEPALIRALQTNQIYGAGLDVFVHEPPSRNEYEDLFSLDNVVVLSHVGAQTHQVQRDTRPTKEMHAANQNAAR
ncbi:hypothetical protein JCM10212_006616 [Sporobolomyces blumeae]